jgi:hypothetical protein
MSTLAQVTCALLALIFISTPFLNKALDDKKKEDETWITAVYEVKKLNFLSLLKSLLFSFLLLISCLLTLTTFEYPRFQNAAYCSSIIFFLFFASAFIYSCIFNFDPRRLDKITEKILTNEYNAHKKSAVIYKTDKDYRNALSEYNQNALIGEFFKIFTDFENSIKQATPYEAEYSLKHLPLFQIIKILSKEKKITTSEAREIKDLIRFRNLLAHKAYDLQLDDSTLKSKIHTLKNIKDKVELRWPNFHKSYQQKLTSRVNFKLPQNTR